MVGLIQKILVDIILEAGGPETLEKIRNHAGIDRELDFQINKNYSDEEWQKFLGATCEILNLTAQEAEDLYAKKFLEDSRKRFPTWFDLSKNSYEFLCRQPTIHNNFASGIKNKEERAAINDKFTVNKESDHKVITTYRSPNGHCGLYMSLAQNVIDLYKDKATITQEKCTKEGDSECEIHIEWQEFNTKD